ncbi:MAG: beta-phosphoglucomutase [Bacteroidetes bacterium HGW-Bacteroidetes-2]|jgi:beta-phosphoglucomutase|nr:MAG: beta-phosphoglucomutase [Bacteroidetes bacterium HGW-Bacteroidetes-2]
MKKTCFIFDLDGVLVDTAKFHFIAWQNLAMTLDIDFTETKNEQLKGVSRIQSLEKILAWGNKCISADTFKQLLTKKNEHYLRYVKGMTTKDILPGVMPVLNFLKEKECPMALGSSSKNAQTILNKIELTNYFKVIVDGNSVTKAKPNPEVFIKAAQLLNCLNSQCVVFEDSIAGIQAANTANMQSIGIGSAEILNEAHFVFPSFEEIKIPFIQSLMN